MKKIMKFASMTTLSVCMFLSAVAVNADVNNQPLESLKRYNTEQSINLRGQQIKLPTNFQTEKDQFRGIWVSTVFNLDFPNQKNMSEESYKANYRELLNNLENLNMNSVIFQVRPKADTFYESNINPWSEYLTGQQGKSPGWDPMAWMIEETHKRGMEFHAWFNPYRVTTGNQDINTLANDNWAKKNPEKTFNFGNKIYLNPGEPEVIKHVTDTVMEVVENYDVDAIHFDDYFYPNRHGSDIEKFYTQSEKNTYDKYGGNFSRVSDWRRDNVDKLISGINTKINNYNLTNDDNVEFGISPFGIWGHEKNNPLGSKTPTSSTSSHDNQFADTRKWVKNNWIDYIAPQVYWAFDTAAAPYGEITHWWADTVKGTDVDLYIGHGPYKKADVNNTDKNWKNPNEILNQLKFNSLYEEIGGSIFFRYKSMLESPSNAPANNQFIKTLKSDFFNKKVNIPNKSFTVDIEEEEDIFDENGELSLIPQIVKAIKPRRN